MGDCCLLLREFLASLCQMHPSHSIVTGMTRLCLQPYLHLVKHLLLSLRFIAWLSTSAFICDSLDWPALKQYAQNAEPWARKLTRNKVPAYGSSTISGLYRRMSVPLLVAFPWLDTSFPPCSVLHRCSARVYSPPQSLSSPSYDVCSPPKRKQRLPQPALKDSMQA